MADRHDKTEAPTPRRRKESRRKGQVARSQDLVAWAQLLAFAVMARSTGARSAAVLDDLFERIGTLSASPNAGEASALLGWAMSSAVAAAMPALVTLAVVSIVGNIAQTGLPTSAHGLKPKMERLNPMKGIKRMVSPMSVWEAGKVLLRAGVLAAVSVPDVQGIARSVLEMGNPGVGPVFASVADDCLRVVRNVAAAGLLLAAVDYVLQRRRIMKSIRMSKQEIKDEARQTDGDPHVKAEIRARQAAMSRNRMMAEVATATAVIVNPTHVAVALRYDAATGAPVVVAKGRGAVALRIREEAAHHNVPILRDIPLARALHVACELGQEIPLELYEAVARVLAVLLAGSPRAV